MGLDNNGIKFLLHARSQGASFERTAMLGRQGLHLSAEQLANALSSAHLPLTAQAALRLFVDHRGFAEGFFKLLGAKEIVSFDATSYEQASHVQDFNLPIDSRWHEYFDVVLDGGCLEHIFNFPVAIQNCMQMVRVGGHFLGITPANNFLGHGFYQFSPELFFRVLSKQNGFSTEVLLFEDGIESRWLAVRDPAEMKVRGTLINYKPTYLLVLARKTLQVPSFTIPQQSDYEAQWEEAGASEKSFSPARQTSIAGRVLSRFRDWLSWAFINRHTKDMFRPY
jgi:SAM-dependent methyltransferase